MEIEIDKNIKVGILGTGYALFKTYAKMIGATKKVVGDYAYKSPRYNQKKNRGRYVRVIRLEKEKVAIRDNKIGVIWLYPKK